MHYIHMATSQASGMPGPLRSYRSYRLLLEAISLGALGKLATPPARALSHVYVPRTGASVPNSGWQINPKRSEARTRFQSRDLDRHLRLFFRAVALHLSALPLLTFKLGATAYSYKLLQHCCQVGRRCMHVYASPRESTIRDVGEARMFVPTGRLYLIR